MKALPWILVFILIAALVVIYIEVPSGQLQREYEKDKAYQRTLDSLQVKIDSIQKEKVAWMRFVTDSEQRANKLENEARIWKSRYEKERRNNRHFSTDSVDSLLLSIK